MTKSTPRFCTHVSIVQLQLHLRACPILRNQKTMGLGTTHPVLRLYAILDIKPFEAEIIYKYYLKMQFLPQRKHYASPVQKPIANVV